MYILFVADTHDGLDLSEIDYCVGRIKPQRIIGLGDVSLNDYVLLCEKFKGIPVGGILGNHDGLDLFKVLSDNGYNIADLHKRHFSINNSSFIGMSGSLKYKDDNSRALITQEQCSLLLDKAPYADVILTHDKPADDTIGFDPHGGLIGIRDYIYDKKPIYNIHGHLHEFYTKQIGQTTELCIYKYALCELTKYDKTTIRVISSQTFSWTFCPCGKELVDFHLKNLI